MASLTLTVAPVDEPITLDEAKQQISIPSTDTTFDGLVGALISAGREYAERLTGIACCTQTWLLTLDAFPFGSIVRDPNLGLLTPAEYPLLYPGFPSLSTYKDNYIRIPRTPVQSPVASISYYDSTGNQQTLAENTDFIVDYASSPVRISPAPGTVWPSTQSRLAAVQVAFKCGYADTSLIPNPVKHAVRLMVGDWFEHREDVTDGRREQPMQIPRGVDALLAPYRVWWAADSNTSL